MTYALPVKLLLGALLILAVLAGCQSSVPQGEKAVFTWHNPVRTGPDWIRDPTILKVGDTYYMTGTYMQEGVSETDPEAWPGIKLWSSSDLKRWREVPGFLVRNAQFTWADTLLWAPEIFAHEGKFYLTFSAQDTSGACDKQSLAVAVAKSITGPYEVLTPDAPLLCGNDTSLFADDDERVYALQTGITVTEISLEPLAVVGEQTHVIADAETPGAWDSAINEGPFMVKRDGTYYLFWSGTARGYEVGYATAEHPLGPFAKHEHNPIYGACRAEFEKACAQSADNPFREVGHGNPFAGPDGELWLSSHGIGGGRAYKKPRLVLDPLHFDEATKQFSGKVSYTPRAAVLPHNAADALTPTQAALATP